MFERNVTYGERRSAVFFVYLKFMKCIDRPAPIYAGRLVVVMLQD